MKSRYQKTGILEVGCDEAGRGPLAGPVVAAAVLFPIDFIHDDIRDSKKLKEQHRIEIEKIIYEHAIATGIGVVSPTEIDQYNIRNASILAMHRALDKINQSFDYIIVDGNFFKPYREIPYQTIVKGDDLYLSIAAASILAKNHRDQLMLSLHQKHPEYNWDSNKGYPTKYHIQAIKKHGYTPYHRKTFQPKELNKPLSLFD